MTEYTPKSNECFPQVHYTARKRFYFVYLTLLPKLDSVKFTYVYSLYIDMNSFQFLNSFAAKPDHHWH